MAGVVTPTRTGSALPAVADLIGAVAPLWVDAAGLRARATASLASGLTRELWKYTPIAGFAEAIGAATPAEARLRGVDQAGIEAVPLQSMDAARERRVRQAIAEAMDGPRHALADLSLLRAGGGWLIEVTGQLAEPLHIDHPPRGIAPIFLLLSPGASAVVIEHGDNDGFLSQISHVDVARGARLVHHRAALRHDQAHYSLLDVHVAADAGYRLNQAAVGGTRRRAEVRVVLHGPGADVTLWGAYLVEDGTHLDQQLVVEHRAGRTRSRQKFHGIGAGKGKSVFNGRIHIHPEAPGSDAALSNRNLALHPDAEMNTKPELEIYTDDVRCAHGATVGRMSDDSLFYLKARGIPDAEARRLLAWGFVRECLDGPLAEAAAERFREALS